MKLNAVSSFIPLGTDPEQDKFQLFARGSWNDQFDRIVLFNAPNPELASDQCVFMDGYENPPRIKDMAAASADMEGITVFLNSDIHLGSQFRSVIEECVNRGFVSGTTCRHNYDKATMDLSKAEMHPGGFDLFYGTQAVWKHVANDIPEVFRIGITIYDAWLLSFLQINYGPERFCNFWKRRVMFHPLGTSKAEKPRKFYEDIDRWISQHTEDRYLYRSGQCTVID